MPKLNVVASIIDKVAGHVDKFTLDKEEKAQKEFKTKSKKRKQKRSSRHNSRKIMKDLKQGYFDPEDFTDRMEGA